MDRIKPIKITKDMKISELVSEMEEAGFGARKIGQASEIMKKMFSDSACTVFLGVAGAMVPAGMKEILIDMIKEDKISVFVTTGANLTHDLAEALGESHYACDVWDDVDFSKKGFDRIHNVFMKNTTYEKIERFFEENWEKFQNCKNITSFLRKIGELLLKEENSLLRICYEKNIPIFCPSIADSGIGLMVWGRLAAGKKLSIDAFEDMKSLIDIAWNSKKKGVIYLGGGVPKNFIQQSLQFSTGADYGIQITVDRPEPGGSSGAPLEEGISWGKLKPTAKRNSDYADVFCDATIALPLLWASVK
ncbi:deoxyhypusine synthase [Candidatus Pacearchaeota archaeon]|nr:deoxyhypusine synthase [Candidatus Pacearchaeota archaeon]